MEYIRSLNQFEIEVEVRSVFNLMFWIIRLSRKYMEAWKMRNAIRGIMH